MPRTFEDADDALKDKIRDFAWRHHPDLAEADVTFGVLLAHAPRDENDDPKGPAIKHGGYAAAATIRIVKIEDRAAGMPDLLLVIDGDELPTWSDARLEAVVDHEFCHPVLVVDKDGAIVRDDLNRPKMRMRKHDWQIGGFDEVAERHKEIAVEVEYLLAVGSNGVRQGWLRGF